MPPKRAAKAAAKPQAASDKKATATRSTRSRAQKETPPQEDVAGDSSVARSTRTRKSTTSEKDVPATPTEAPEQDAPAPRTVQRPLTRGRPPRTVKKVAPSQANKATLDAMKKRMEEERRATQAGVVPQPAKETMEQAAERSIREAENNDGDAALVPARAVAVPRSPSQVRQTAMPGTAVKAPATVRQPQSAVKMQSTPGAETSVLALQNFRRRARQPSLLQMVQNPDLAPEGDETTDFTLGMSDDEEDEFAPHDESTPLQKAKAKQAEAEAEEEQQEEVADEPVVERAQTPPQVEPEEDDLYGATPQQSRGRKRNSDAMEGETEIQVVRSSPSLPSPAREVSEQQEFEPIPATAPEEDDEEEPATTESQQRRLLSDTYADPVSSSPPADPISPTSPEQRPARQPTASPSAIRKSNRGNAAKKPKPMTTAALRALLPKRRSPHIRNDYDIPSSSSAEANSSAFEDDNRRGAKKPKTRKLMQPKKKGGPSPVAAQKRTVAPTTKTSTSRTYSRGGNKENQAQHISSGSSELSELNSDDLEEANETADTSVSTIGAGKNEDVVSDEMKKAREKFADVDNWEMEFESASLGASGNSSPWR